MMWIDVFMFQAIRIGSRGERDQITGPLPSCFDGCQESQRTSSRLGLCEKELGHTD